MVKKNFLFYIIITTIVLISLPLVIRFLSHGAFFIGEEPYYHMRVAEKISRTDNLIFFKRPLLVTPYHFLLIPFNKYLTISVLSLILALATIIIFYLILKKYKISPEHRFFISMLLIVSPVFIYLFAVPNPNSLAILLTLTGFYLFLKKNKIAMTVSVILFIMVSMFSLFNVFVVLSLLLFQYNRKKKRPWIIASIVFMFITSSLYRASLYNSYLYLNNSLFVNLFSDIGSLMGFGIFTVILALVGLIRLFGEKQRYYPIYLLLVFLMVSFVLINPSITFYLAFIVAILAGTGLYMLKRMKWKLKTIKNLTIIILICGLLFSTFSYIGRINNMPPNKEIFDSLEWMQSQEQGYVFSHYSNGYYIQYAGFPVIIDDLYYPTNPVVINDTDTIFYSRNLEKTKRLLDKYNISYIWVDSKMKHDIWEKPEEGLLFLFRNSETFKNIYSTPNIEVWQYIAKNESGI